MTSLASLTLAAAFLMPLPAQATSLRVAASTTVHFWGPIYPTADGYDLSETLDRGLCKHPNETITIDPNDPNHWILDFPSADSCRDPANVPDWIIDMYIEASSPNSAHGSWAGQPSCWVNSASGVFDIDTTTPGTAYLQLTGYRSIITFKNCD